MHGVKLIGATEYSHTGGAGVSPDWFSENVRPATVIVPVRALTSLFLSME
jgi:hypothetical protein